MVDPVIAFLTDYGLRDDFVGVCHGVIVRGCPRARIIDLSHRVAPHDVRAGAVMLARALPYVPATVWLAVVDPGVGGPRRGIAVRAADGRHFVGPDNGLLGPALAAAGGAREAVDLESSPLTLVPTSATFHGRDVFAPAAAALAAGAGLGELGTPVDPSSVQTLELPVASVSDGRLTAHVVSIDGFGNLALDATRGDLERALPAGAGAAISVQVGELTRPATLQRAFSDVAPGELIVYGDGYGSLALAVNRGSAAEALAASVDVAVRLSTAVRLSAP